MRQATAEQLATGYTITEAGCWEWDGSISTAGYGQLCLTPRKHSPAHRASYEMHVDTIPEGLVIDHLCRNRACVNPDHLEPVENVENILRGEGIMAQNARKTHCDQGHPFDADNTYIMPSGGRMCRACRNASKAKYRAKLRAAGKPLDWTKKRKPCKGCGGPKSAGDNHYCQACKSNERTTP